MSHSTGYYSVIQYCPDPSRMEAANVGVVLLCPERDFLGVRTAKGNDRIRRFFGSGDHDWGQVNAVKLSIQRRLEADRERFKGLADLERFAATRANAMRLTPPRAVQVESPEAELERLFERLVGGRVQKGPSRVRDTLEKAFAAEPIARYVKKKVTVTLPAFHKPVTVPYGFQNGRFHLIQPVRFRGLLASDLLKRAGQYAVEGDLLYDAPDEALGDLKLVVVGEFGSNQAEVAEAVGKVFDKNRTDLFRLDELDRLLETIRSNGRPLADPGSEGPAGGRGSAD
jgi:hypothetical protein